MSYIGVASYLFPHTIIIVQFLFSSVSFSFSLLVLVFLQTSDDFAPVILKREALERCLETTRG